MGGTWLWDGLQFDGDLSWLIEALANHTTIFVTDGSYNPDVSKDICSTGWVIFCSHTKKKVTGSFYEVSASASNYRGELMGVVTLHLFLLVVEEFFHIPPCSPDLWCDNQGAINRTKKNKHRIGTQTKHSDLLRVLQWVKNHMKSKFVYNLICFHQDTRARAGRSSVCPRN